MADERQVRTVTTPSGVAVQLKDFITAGEFLDLSDASEKNAWSKATLAKKLLESAVVSVAGSAENVAEALSNLRLPDYTFLTAEVTKLINGDFPAAKDQ